MPKQQKQVKDLKRDLEAAKSKARALEKASKESKDSQEKKKNEEKTQAEEGETREEDKDKVTIKPPDSDESYQELLKENERLSLKNKSLMAELDAANQRKDVPVRYAKRKDSYPENFSICVEQMKERAFESLDHYERDDLV